MNFSDLLSHRIILVEQTVEHFVRSGLALRNWDASCRGDKGFRDARWIRIWRTNSSSTVEHVINSSIFPRNADSWYASARSSSGCDINNRMREKRRTLPCYLSCYPVEENWHRYSSREMSLDSNKRKKGRVRIGDCFTIRQSRNFG